MTTTSPLSPALIFDFGGVLMDWNPRYLYRKLFPGDVEGMENLLAKICTPQWNARLDEGRPFAEAVEELVEQHPEFEEQIRAYDTRWEEMMAEPHWHTVAILETLHRCGYPLYALSNWSTEKFALVRPRYEFFGWFRDILLSAQVGINKPDPRIFELMRQRTGLPGGQCLLIDDTPANIVIARSLGFRAIHFQSSKQLEADLHDMGILSNGHMNP